MRRAEHRGVGVDDLAELEHLLEAAEVAADLNVGLIPE